MSSRSSLFVYKANSRLAKATQSNPVSKKRKKQKQQKEVAQVEPQPHVMVTHAFTEAEAGKSLVSLRHVWST